MPGVEFVVGDAESLPYPDDSFDAVICNFGLHHLLRPHRAITETGRVLRPRGRLVASVWDEDVNDLAIVPAAVYGAGAAAPAEVPAPPPQPSYLDDGDIATLLAGSDLTLLEKEVTELWPTFGSSDELWSGWLAAAIRTGPVLVAQPDPIRQRAREAFDCAVRELTAPDGTVNANIQVVALISERN